MIMIPMTTPAARALSEETPRPIDCADVADERGDGQGGEEAEDHGRDAGQDLEHRLGHRAEAVAGVAGEVDRRQHADRAGHQHGDRA